MKSYSSQEIKDCLEKLLSSHPEGISESDVLRYLNNNYPNLLPKPLDFCDNLNLFQNHFVLFHFLHRLQDDLFLKGECIDFSPLCLRILLINESMAVGQINTLRSYYLDIHNMEEHDQDSLNELLNNFWRKYIVHFDQDDALKVLNLKQNAQWPDIKKSYKKLCQQFHPDRGGDSAEFHKVQEAFDQLKKVHNKK